MDTSDVPDWVGDTGVVLGAGFVAGGLAGAAWGALPGIGWGLAAAFVAACWCAWFDRAGRQARRNRRALARRGRTGLSRRYTRNGPL